MINKMTKQSHIKGCIMKIGILGMLILAGIGFYSCDDITKGYLETDEAGYVTDTLRIAADPGNGDTIPYQSEKIQGVIGTFPIHYELAALRDDSGREVGAGITSQVEVVLTGVFRIAKDHTIPVGTYRADLRVWNLGRSFVLPGIYTIVVGPAAETAASGSREEG